MKRLLFILLSFSSITLHAQEIIDVAVRGISDENRDGVQQDRLEAILDAKRQACEKAGLRIESTTTVENFQTVYDFVESQAEAVLLPGFQIIDNGYGEDGTYTVVLVGKIKTTVAEASSETAFFHIIIWLYEGDEAPDKPYQLLDRLYEWLQTAHGEFTLGEMPIESWEDQLVEVSKTDSLYGRQRYYAFKYQLPSGTAQYVQSTRQADGSLAVHKTQKIRLRPGLNYIMEVGDWNAIYFENPTAFEGSVTNARLYGNYPADFTTIYMKP